MASDNQNKTQAEFTGFEPYDLYSEMLSTPKFAGVRSYMEGDESPVYINQQDCADRIRQLQESTSRNMIQHPVTTTRLAYAVGLQLLPNAENPPLIKTIKTGFKALQGVQQAKVIHNYSSFIEKDMGLHTPRELAQKLELLSPLASEPDTSNSFAETVLKQLYRNLLLEEDDTRYIYPIVNEEGKNHFAFTLPVDIRLIDDHPTLLIPVVLPRTGWHPGIDLWPIHFNSGHSPFLESILHEERQPSHPYSSDILRLSKATDISTNFHNEFSLLCFGYERYHRFSFDGTALYLHITKPEPLTFFETEVLHSIAEQFNKYLPFRVIKLDGEDRKPNPVKEPDIEHYPLSVVTLPLGFSERAATIPTSFEGSLNENGKLLVKRSPLPERPQVIYGIGIIPDQFSHMSKERLYRSIKYDRRQRGNTGEFPGITNYLQFVFDPTAKRHESVITGILLDEIGRRNISMIRAPHRREYYDTHTSYKYESPSDKLLDLTAPITEEEFSELNDPFVDIVNPSLLNEVPPCPFIINLNGAYISCDFRATININTGMLVTEVFTSNKLSIYEEKALQVFTQIMEKSIIEQNLYQTFEDMFQIFLSKA